MIDAYSIGASLTLDDQIFGKLQQVYDKFDAVDQAVQRINSKLADTVGLIGNAASGASSMARAFTAAADAAERIQRASGSMGGGMALGMPYQPSGSSAAASGGGYTVPYDSRQAIAYGQSESGTPGVPATIPGQDRFSSGPERWSHVPITGYGQGGGTYGGGGGGGGPPPNFIFGNDDGGNDASMSGMYPRPAAGGAGNGLDTSDYATMTFGGGMIADAAGSYIGDTFNAAAAVAKTRALMIGRGASTSSADMAVAQARVIQQNNPGVSLNGATQMILDAYSITGNMKSALNVAQPFATAGFILHEYGDDEVAAGLYNTLKSGELRGLLNSKNPDGSMNVKPLQNYIDTVVTAGIVSGGRVDPASAMGIMKNASAEGILMDPTALATSLILSQSLGGHKVGTGINALAMQFLGGKMSQANARVLHEEGLLPDWMFGPHDGKILKKYQTGIGQVMIPPGALAGQDEFANNPYAWIDDKLLPGIEKKYGSTPADIMTGIYQTMSRIPGGRLAAEEIFQHVMIERQLGYYGQVGSPDTVAGKLRANDPTVQTAAFVNALVGLEQALGNAAMPQAISALDKLTHGLNDFANWQGKHPHASEAITDTALGVGALGALGLVTGAIGLLTKPLVKVGKYAGRAFTGGAGEGVAAESVSGLELGAAGGAEFGPGALLTGLAGAIAAALLATGSAQPGAIRGRQMPGSGKDGPSGGSADPVHVQVTNLGQLLGALAMHQGAEAAQMPSGPTGYNRSGSAPPAPGQPFGPL